MKNRWRIILDPVFRLSGRTLIAAAVLTFSGCSSRSASPSYKRVAVTTPTVSGVRSSRPASEQNWPVVPAVSSAVEAEIREEWKAARGDVAELDARASEVEMVFSFVAHESVFEDRAAFECPPTVTASQEERKKFGAADGTLYCGEYFDPGRREIHFTLFQGKPYGIRHGCRHAIAWLLDRDDWKTIGH